MPPPPPARRPPPPAVGSVDPGLSLRHPAVILTAVAAAIGILLSVSFKISDPDIFQHLRVGRAIWESHSVPAQYLWTWPAYGTAEVLPSWLFRALLWPFWAVGGIWGLYAWRWLTTLAAFGMLWAVARRLGARGLIPLVVMVVCSLIYRQRSQARPETLVVVLMAAELLILETRRQGGRDHSLWIVGIAWIWANAHISYYLGLMMLALFWLDAGLASRRPVRAAAGAGRPTGTGRLGVVLLASAAVSFLNPFGWRALWQPFDFFLHLRHEALYQSVGELMPIDWDNNRVNGLLALMIGWPVLAAWHALRGRLDRVEAVLLIFFTTITLFGQRFLGFYATIAAPYAARDLATLGAPRGVPFVWRLPAGARAALAILACGAVGLAEWRRPTYPLGVGLIPLWYPVAACDFMEAQGVGGRGFNDFDLAGYMLYRFWPRRDRLPFMDIHMTGAPADRYLYAWLHSREQAWRDLDRKYHFDYALVGRRVIKENPLLDFLDADSAYALVFADDVAALFVRRQGPLAPVARRFAYRELPAGGGRTAELQRRCSADSAFRGRLAAELGRALASSPRDAKARSLLANIALMEGRGGEARQHLLAALAVDPFTLRAHERLGLLDLEEGHPGEALREFREEARMNGALPGLDLRVGQAYRRLGDAGAARRWYQRELRRNPANPEARDSLARMTGGS